MRPKEKELHELPYTEMVKSDNIRLVSELFYNDIGMRSTKKTVYSNWFNA